MQGIEKIRSTKHPNVILKVIPGHFVTPNAHVNYFIDMTTLKARESEASAAAAELARQIAHDTIVDTIVCIDGCEIIGAYLAQELTNAGIYSMNAHETIYVITPEYINSGQLLFRENLIPMLKGKNVLLLMASATTGQTIAKATQAMSYYGAHLSGISAIFSAADSAEGVPIKSLFSIEDIPDYKSFSPECCELCKAKAAIDAFANGYGYSRIN